MRTAAQEACAAIPACIPTPCRSSLSRCAPRPKLSGLIVTLVVRAIMDWSFPGCASIGAFEYLFAQYPGVQFVLHGLNYGEESWNGIRLQNANPNLWLETSCLQGLGAIAQLVSAGDAQRVLLGVGVPIQYPACGIAKLEKGEDFLR